MPYADHLRLTAIGVMDTSLNGGGPVEQFTFRVNLSDPPSTLSFTQDRVNDYATDVAAFLQRVTTKVSGVARLRQVKLAQINSLGKYRSEPLIVDMDVQAGSTNAFVYPPQIALAVSLVTARRGPTGKGRFYLPVPTAAIGGNTGLIAALDRDGIRDSAVQFINDLNNTPALDPANTPRVTVASSKGYNSDVTAVRIGLAYDTIRSRREDLQEAYGLEAAVTAN